MNGSPKSLFPPGAAESSGSTRRHVRRERDAVRANSDFNPAWWLANGHLQTIWPALFRRIEGLRRRRERLWTHDGDFVDLDWCGGEARPIVIILHGLTGSADSLYVKGLQQALDKAKLRSVALNFRGCSGEPNRKARSYHSGYTGDLHQLYELLRSREPGTPLAAVGFSLGGNVLLKWLGENGGSLSLFGAVAVSVPFVLSACADRMERGLSRCYRNRLIADMKRSLQLRQRFLESIGETTESEKLKRLGDLSSIASFWEFDERVIAGLYPFTDVYDYYRRSSSRQFLAHIRVPTLLIQAEDDPFMTPDVIPTPDELSWTTRMEVTPGGGHVGFVRGPTPVRADYWLDTRIPQFFLCQLTR